LSDPTPSLLEIGTSETMPTGRDTVPLTEVSTIGIVYAFVVGYCETMAAA
jgi:hypothetical protein